MSKHWQEPSHFAKAREENRNNGLRTRAFLVVGPHEIRGKVKGERVDIELTDDQAEALIQAGHVIPAITALEGGAYPEPEVISLKDDGFPTEYSTPGYLGSKKNLPAAEKKPADAPKPAHPKKEKGE